MADLEKLLLEAAGMPAGSGRDRHQHQPSRSRQQVTHSDDDSDSKDDNSSNTHGYAGRKRSRTQVPLKKRSKQSGVNGVSDDDEDDNSGFDHDIGSSDDSDVGSDLYKDEDDREQLAKMTELERELILHDRAAKKDDKKLQKQMKSRQESEKKIQPWKERSTSAASGVRTSARFAERTPAKSNALNELRARRMKQESDSKLKILGDVSSAGSPTKRKRFAGFSPAGYGQGEIESELRSEDDESTGDGGMDYSDDEKDEIGNEIPTFEDIKSITIRRSKLAKWLMEPFFDDLMVGCFVRIGIGMKSGQNVYRLCIVKCVDLCDTNRRYQLENKTTCKYLTCVWGSETSAARWQMARVSDSLPSEEEFNHWVREVERTSGCMPTRQEVLGKKEEIEKAINNCVYNAATVRQMVQEKKAVSTRPLNIAAEKEKLRREMEIAEERNDNAEVERIKARLQELEAAQQDRGIDQKALKLIEMNRKNRAENFRNATVSKPVNTSLKAGDVGYDPFSRRWTRSTNLYIPKPGGGGATASAEAAEGSTAVRGTGVDSNSANMTATTAALEAAAAGAGKLVDTSAPVDQRTSSNVLHDFELPISLALLHRHGGPCGATAAFLARKQRVEAAIGFQVPEHDGRRHSLTLTLADYKRRRGLL